VHSGREWVPQSHNLAGPSHAPSDEKTTRNKGALLGRPPSTQYRLAMARVAVVTMWNIGSCQRHAGQTSRVRLQDAPPLTARSRRFTDLPEGNPQRRPEIGSTHQRLVLPRQLFVDSRDIGALGIAGKLSLIARSLPIIFNVRRRHC
jgi:hypothetical protein